MSPHYGSLLYYHNKESHRWTAHSSSRKSRLRRRPRSHPPSPSIPPSSRVRHPVLPPLPSPLRENLRFNFFPSIPWELYSFTRREKLNRVLHKRIASWEARTEIPGTEEECAAAETCPSLNWIVWWSRFDHLISLPYTGCRPWGSALLTFAFNWIKMYHCASLKSLVSLRDHPVPCFIHRLFHYESRAAVVNRIVAQDGTPFNLTHFHISRALETRKVTFFRLYLQKNVFMRLARKVKFTRTSSCCCCFHTKTKDVIFFFFALWKGLDFESESCVTGPGESASLFVLVLGQITEFILF